MPDQPLSTSERFAALHAALDAPVTAPPAVGPVVVPAGAVERVRQLRAELAAKIKRVDR